MAVNDRKQCICGTMVLAHGPESPRELRPYATPKSMEPLHIERRRRALEIRGQNAQRTM